VEVFKDEAFRRCARCGHRFANPGANFGCAEWCSLAEQCVGVVSKGPPSEAGKPALAARLIESLAEHFQHAAHRLARALNAFQHAKELLGRQGGDPSLVIPAALLFELVCVGRIDGSCPSGPPSGTDAWPAVNAILGRSGLDPASVERVGHILRSGQAGSIGDDPESRLAWEAYRRAVLGTRGQGLGDRGRHLHNV
jgi:hypothetical protein